MNNPDETSDSKVKQRTHGEISSMLPSFFREIDKLNISKMTTPEKSKQSPPKTITSPPIQNVSQMSSFDRFLSSRTAYERTSTLKKKKKISKTNALNNKISVKNLFNSKSEDHAYDKLNKELDQISDNIKFSKNDFFKEINDFHDTPIKVKTNEYEICNPIETTPKVNSPTIMNNIMKSTSYSCPANNSSYSFSIGNFALPETPIARKNKIRRNAWLSDHKTLVSNPDSPNEKKKLNVSIKVVQNESPEQPKFDYVNAFSNLSTDISKCLSEKFRDLLPEFTDKILKELDSSRKTEDKTSEKNAEEKVDKPIFITPSPKQLKPPPRFTMSDVVDEAMKRQKLRQSKTEFHKVNRNLANNPTNANVTEDDEIRRISVQEEVMRIENLTRLSQSAQASLTRKDMLTPVRPPLIDLITPIIRQSGTVIKRTVFRESIYEPHSDTHITPNTGETSNTGGTLRKQMTTRVTVNFCKTSRRKSDLGSGFDICQIPTCAKSALVLTPRHSICGELRFPDSIRQSQTEDLINMFCGKCKNNITPEQLRGLMDNPLTMKSISNSAYRLSEISNNALININVSSNQYDYK